MSSFKLLEITILSAHDLPPVSKMLRIFAVAYITPDHKLTTRIDHHGHTTPSWNHKMLFHVDQAFLKKESSFLAIDIFNLAWLRDLPIGTARIHLNTLSPPLTKNNAYRRLSLQLSRPSGHLKGTLNLGIQLLDDVVDDHISFFSSAKMEEESLAQEIRLSDVLKENITGPEIKSKNESWCSTSESTHTSWPESEPETRTNTSEMEVDQKNEFYREEAAAEYGSEIFENWTELGDASEDQRREPENAKWAAESVIPVMSELKLDCHRKRAEKKNGPSKRVGNRCGFEFTFICCGSNEMRMKKKKKKLNRGHQRAHSCDTLGNFHF